MDKDEINKEKFKVFFKYLKENNLYNKYRYNVKYCHRLNSLFTLTFMPRFLKVESSEILEKSFSWANSKEGSGFWSNASLKFKRYLYKLYKENRFNLNPNNFAELEIMLRFYKII